MGLNKKIKKGMAVIFAIAMVLTIDMVPRALATDTTPVAETTASRTIYVTDGQESSRSGAGTMESPYQSLRYALEQARDGDTIMLTSNIVYRSDSNTQLFEINKSVTIDAQSNNLTIRGAHLILKKNAVLKNMTLNLLQDGAAQAKIYANGYSLTFDNVSTNIGTNFNQDGERPIVYGGDQDGNPEGNRAIIKVINGNQESRFKKIVAGSESGNSDVPVDIIIENRLAKVDDVVILGGEDGRNNARVTFTSNARNITNIDARRAENNFVELNNISTFTLRLKDVKDLTLKDNSNISSAESVSVLGKLTIEDGSTLAIKSPLFNSIGTLAGSGKLFIGEDATVRISNVEDTVKPVVEFDGTLSDLNARNNVFSPVINTNEFNFEKLSMKMYDSDRPIIMKNGRFEEAPEPNNDEENENKVREVQDLYNRVYELEKEYEAIKTEAGEAISQEEKERINQVKNEYEDAYTIAYQEFQKLDQDLKDRVNKRELNPQVEYVEVNDINDNNRVDEEEIDEVNRLFTEVMDIKNSYDEKVTSAGEVVNTQEAESINEKIRDYSEKITQANEIYERLDERLRERVQRPELPDTLTTVVANDIDNNDILDETEIEAVQNLYSQAKELKQKYDKAMSDAGVAFSEQDVEAIKSAKDDYNNKLYEANNTFMGLSQQLQPNVDRFALEAIVEELPEVNDRNNNEVVDTEENPAQPNDGNGENPAQPNDGNGENPAQPNDGNEENPAQPNDGNGENPAQPNDGNGENPAQPNDGNEENPSSDANVDNVNINTTNSGDNSSNMNDDSMNVEENNVMPSTGYAGFATFLLASFVGTLSTVITLIFRKRRK